MQFFPVHPRIQRHRHRHLACQRQKFPQQLALHRCKSGKSVQHHFAASEHPGFVHPFADHIQDFLRGHVPLPQIFPESPVNHLDVLQLVKQHRLPGGNLQQLIHPGRADIVLHQLGDQGFHLADRSRLLQTVPQHLQIFPLLLHYPLQHQGFPGILQHRPGVSAHLLENPVGEALKAEHVDIQDAAPAAHGHQLLLGLHAELLRHDHQIPSVRMPPGLVQHSLIQKM